MSSINANGRRRILTPVKRNTADSFLLLMISGFGVTVILTRLFLEVTGYPQIGDSAFHLAHVLWGGLFLFIAIVLVLVLANHWALWLSALLSGIGTGLFIDEVGKFITQNNDYFVPLAFPIIYAFLIACVWFYFRVRRSDPRDSRTLMYHSFQDMTEALDQDLDLTEHSELVTMLTTVAMTTGEANYRKLSIALLDCVESQEPLPSQPNLLSRSFMRLVSFISSNPSRRVLKTALVIGLAFFGLSAVTKFLGLYSIAYGATPDVMSTLYSYVIVNGKSQYVVSHPNLLIVYALSIVAVGITSLVSTLMFIFRGERLGLRVGMTGLVLSLTIVNLVTFYFSQLYAIVDAFGQLVLIGLAEWYRWRFMLKQSDATADLSRGREIMAI